MHTIANTSLGQSSESSTALSTQLNDIEGWVNARRRRVAHVLVAVMLALSAIIAHLEIDRLIAGTLSPDGRSAPLGNLLGPLALTTLSNTHDIWNTAVESAGLGQLIIIAVLVDAVLVFAYFQLFRRAIRHCSTRGIRIKMLAALVIAEAIEAICLVSAAIVLIANADIPEWLIGLIATIATVKLLLFAALTIGLVFDDAFRRTAGRITRQTLRAFWLHRLSAALVIALFVLACIPADGVLDQLPDIQRQWADSPDYLANVIAAFLAVGIAMVAAFAFGRMRVRAPLQLLRDAAQRTPEYSALPGATDDASASQVYAYGNPQLRMTPNRTPPQFQISRIDWWWATPLAALVFALSITIALSSITSVFSGAPLALPGIHWWTIGVFLAVPLLAIVTSLRPVDAPRRWYRSETVAMRARYGWLTGDLIAVLILSVAGLGLVRSFSGALAALFAIGLGSSGPWWWALIFASLGIAAAVAGPLLLIKQGPARTSRYNPTRALTPNDDRLTHNLILVSLLAGSILLLVLLALLPVLAATVVGAPALVIGILTLWGVVLGSFTVALQEHPPLPIFIRLRLRATPVLTLAVVIPLLAGIVLAASGADDAQLHANREMPADRASVFPSSELSSADIIDRRLRAISDEGCVLRGADGVAVRPVVVVAAEGGGIRAAYWAARVFDELRASGSCLAQSVLLSSGVSGGSVGMAITAALEQSRREGHVDTESAAAMPDRCGRDAVNQSSTAVGCLLDRLSSPEAVAVGASGLLVRDLVAGSSGVQLPALALSQVDGVQPRADRAALIESTWIDDIDALSLTPDWSESTAIGIPVFNSTDARTKCKVLITPLPVVADREGGFSATERWDCTAPGQIPSVLPVERACFARLDWAGVAMLSARFPTITPAARIVHSDVCGKEDLQLIDGGYAEGSALGTVADLAPLIANRIGQANLADGSTAPQDDSENAAEVPMVPVLLYLKNSAGYDLNMQVAQVSAEPLVPLVGYTAAAKQLTEAVLIQRIAESFTHTDASAESLTSIEAFLPGLAVTVAPRTVPTIVPPLGWALSSYSSESLETALEGQLAPTIPGTTSTTPTLRTLLDAARREGPPITQ